MKAGEALEFLSDRFVVETCLGEPKLFTDMTNWELLNLKSNDILDIPDRLYQEYGQPTPIHHTSLCNCLSDDPQASPTLSCLR
jgi:hypothetical protein